MQPLKSLSQMAASRSMIHSTLLQLNVSSNFIFRRVQSTSMIICKFFILDDGLFYTSTDQVYTKGCALSMGEFIYDNVIYILAPIILSVSVTEFVLLLKSLFCTQPIRTDYLLKWTGITFYQFVLIVLIEETFWRSASYKRVLSVGAVFTSHFSEGYFIGRLNRTVNACELSLKSSS